MSEPRIEVHPDPTALATAVAGELIARLEAAQASGHVPQIGLTGGTIADAIHREVARLSPTSDVDWSRVVIWFGDERFVAPDSPDRNVLQAREAFLDGVGAIEVHEMASTADAVDAAAGAAAYAASMREHGAGQFDVLMLGIGPDGHIASLFPGHAALDVDDAVAVGVLGSPKPPPERISLTFAALNRAESVWFLASGEGKADGGRRRPRHRRHHDRHPGPRRHRSRRDHLVPRPARRLPPLTLTAPPPPIRSDSARLGADSAETCGRPDVGGGQKMMSPDLRRERSSAMASSRMTSASLSERRSFT